MKKPSEGSAVKAALRADARARRDSLPAYMREAANAKVNDRAIALAEMLKPSVLAAYRAIRTEVVPDAIVEWAHSGGVAVVLPVVSGPTTIVFRRYRSGDALVKGTFDTLGPDASAPEVDPDLVIVPLIAFDRTGARLGHGRGFYDRAIWRLRARGVSPVLVGIAFSVQEVAAIPAESHDVTMDWIVTERETIDARHLG